MSPSDDPSSQALTWECIRAGKSWTAPDGSRWCFLASEDRWTGWSSDCSSVVVLEPLEFHRRYPECPQPAWVQQLLR